MPSMMLEMVCIFEDSPVQADTFTAHGPLIKYISIPSDSDSDDTLVTASVFNSPSESMQDLNSIPVAPYEKLSYNSMHESRRSRKIEAAAAVGEDGPHSVSSSDEEDGSDDTLVDGVSIASSCTTFISEGGDAYKCAKGEFYYSRDCNPLDDADYDDHGRLETSNEMPEFIVTGR